MKYIIPLLILFSSPAFCLTKSSAVALTKARIKGLVPRFAELANNCYMFEEDCKIVGNSQVATVKWYMWEFREHPADIQYDSGPDKFTIDGAIRIAKTGNYFGAPVIFNEDLLAVEVAPGNFKALDFFEVLGVLVHEYGHHSETELIKFGLPALRHEELDAIAANIVTYLKDRTRRIQITADEVPGLAEESNLNIYAIDIEWFNGVRNIWSNVFTDSVLGIEEISTSYLQGLACPKSYTDGHLTFSAAAYYASFRKVRAPQFTMQNKTLTLEQEIGEASVLCVDQQMGVFQVFDGYKEGSLRLTFSQNEAGQLVYNAAGSTFRAKVIPPDQNGRSH